MVNDCVGSVEESWNQSWKSRQALVNLCQWCGILDGSFSGWYGSSFGKMKLLNKEFQMCWSKKSKLFPSDPSKYFRCQKWTGPVRDGGGCAYRCRQRDLLLFDVYRGVDGVQRLCSHPTEEPVRMRLSKSVLQIRHGHARKCRWHPNKLLGGEDRGGVEVNRQGICTRSRTGDEAWAASKQDIAHRWLDLMCSAGMQGSKWKG